VWHNMLCCLHLGDGPIPISDVYCYCVNTRVVRSMDMCAVPVPTAGLGHSCYRIATSTPWKPLRHVLLSVPCRCCLVLLPVLGAGLTVQWLCAAA
jgi:hypothetical protein